MDDHFRWHVKNARVEQEAEAARLAAELQQEQERQAQEGTTAREAAEAELAGRVEALRLQHQQIAAGIQRVAGLAVAVSAQAVERHLPVNVIIRPNFLSTPVVVGWLLHQPEPQPIPRNSNEDTEVRHTHSYVGTILSYAGILYNYKFYHQRPPMKWRTPREVDVGGWYTERHYADDTSAIRYTPNRKQEELYEAVTFKPGEPQAWMPVYPGGSNLRFKTYRPHAA